MSDLQIPDSDGTNTGEVRVLQLLQKLVTGLGKNRELIDAACTKIETIQAYEDTVEREQALRALKKKMAKEHVEMKAKKAASAAMGSGAFGSDDRVAGRAEMNEKIKQLTLNQVDEPRMKNMSNMVIIFCLLTVIAYFAIGIGAFCEIEGWNFVNSFYFCMVTITTVGYGDLMPSHDSSKWFCCFFVIFGVGLIGGALGIIGGWVLDKQEEMEEALMLSLGVDDGDSSNDFIQSPAAWACINAFFVVVFFVFIGVFAYMGFDDLTFVDAFYMSCITVTTVGYGDFSPTKEGGRILAIFWILFSVISVARALGSIVDIFLEWRQDYRRKKMLNKQINMGQLTKYDNDGDGKMDFEEFCLLKLQVVGIVDGPQLLECAKQFQFLDRDNSGTVDAADLLQGATDTTDYAGNLREAGIDGWAGDSAAPTQATAGGVGVAATGEGGMEIEVNN